MIICLRRGAFSATLAEAGQQPEQVLVVTITDGEENHSREFTRRQVVELVRAKEADGWIFVFLGAGLDAYDEAGSMGYAGGSVQAWLPDATGADIAFTSLSAKTTDLRRKVRRGEALPTGDFVEGDKPAEADRQRRRSD